MPGRPAAAAWCGPVDPGPASRARPVAARGSRPPPGPAAGRSLSGSPPIRPERAAERTRPHAGRERVEYRRGPGACGHEVHLLECAPHLTLCRLTPAPGGLACRSQEGAPAGAAQGPAQLRPVHIVVSNRRAARRAPPRGAWAMFERFTDRARRVVVLAQEEARMLSHNYIGTEHILLGLILEGEGVAAKALESLGISLEAVRQQVEEIIGQGQQAPSGHIPFTPRAKKVLELSLREALQLGHKYIGTEHILLGLIREGEGVAAQVLVRLGADLNRVRQQVIQLLHGYQGKEPPVEMVRAGVRRGRKLRRAETALASLSALSARMLAMERRLGAGPDTSDLDRQIAEVRRDKEMALAAEAYERAADLRDRERRLIDERLARVREWEAANPGLAG